MDKKNKKIEGTAKTKTNYNMEYQGSCLCKGVQFKIIGNFESFYLCHCSYCRKDTGSAHAANLFSTNAKLEWIKRETEISVFQLPESNHAKAFCATCGSALPNLQMGSKLLVVPAGSLDTKLEKRPDAHLFISSKAAWDEALEEIKRFERLPE
nr:GFA family protein [uncultured Draconibacterium sp.]